jgi:hypothetical protein
MSLQTRLPGIRLGKAKTSPWWDRAQPIPPHAQGGVLADGFAGFPVRYGRNVPAGAPLLPGRPTFLDLGRRLTPQSGVSLPAVLRPADG